MIRRKITLTPAAEPATIDPATISMDGLSAPYVALAQPAAPAGLASTDDDMREIGYALNPGSRPRDPYAPGFFDYLGGLLFEGQLPDAVRRRFEDRRTLDALKAEVLTDPRERLAFISNPGKWAEKVVENYAPHVVPGGDSLMRPGYGSTMAPKVSMAGDTPVYQQGTQVAYGPPKEPDYKDQTDAVIRAAQLALEKVKAENDYALRDRALAVNWYNARTARMNAGRGGSGGSSGGGSGLPQGYSLTPRQ